MSMQKDRLHDDRACPRVLVVDNEPNMRDGHIKNLMIWGYQPFAAEGTGKALLMDARAKASIYRCHIALVDMRLLDDGDSRDSSGLDLAADLKPTVSIIVSGHGNVHATRDAILSKGAFNFVPKEDGPEALRQAIESAVAHACHWEFSIRWHPSYGPDDIFHQLHLDKSVVPRDEIHCILSRLYADREGFLPVAAVELKPIGEQFPSSQRMMTLGRSVILVARPWGVDGQPQLEEVIKIAPAGEISDEIHNYGKYVRSALPVLHTARVEDSKNVIALWDIGAVRYTNLATGRRWPLRHWYSRARPTAIKSALRHLFEEVLGNWYSLETPRCEDSVYSYYRRLIPKLGQRIDVYPNQDDSFALDGITRRLANPIVWVRRHGTAWQFESRWEAHTHGDLHSGNVFVDQFAQTYVIDYERSGPGYVLRDFVELEADIYLRLLPLTREELPLAYQLTELLLEQARPGQPLRWREIPETDEATLLELRKAFAAIGELRRLAHRIVRFETIEEYYWALLMEILISVLRNYADWADQDAAALARDRALLAAALLSERLSR